MSFPQIVKSAPQIIMALNHSMKFFNLSPDPFLKGLNIEAATFFSAKKIGSVGDKQHYATRLIANFLIQIFWYEPRGDLVFFFQKMRPVEKDPVIEQFNTSVEDLFNDGMSPPGFFELSKALISDALSEVVADKGDQKCFDGSVHDVSVMFDRSRSVH
jgi:hypothetical protein